ncbi:hypothetical protein CN378_11155 [Bacillus sp. AFS015802]|uniref:hypothetical protein n=1 Tax=Bacillus sp. AFS015802 TaxID=2033486 RepID=UPI000BF66062|nr:hypothetical protein [Bacillus sp. AFS015802]PFA67396.1 hypothetical protein CN378_11155 [Bacillus sp. AFS015802]
MDQFYKDLKVLGMSVEYELNEWIKEKLDDRELVESVKNWLLLFQAVIILIQLLSLDRTAK